jgi:hypothetical protein
MCPPAPGASASFNPSKKKYRDFARWVGDRETVQRILALTAELKQRARALAKLNEDLTNEIRDDI